MAKSECFAALGEGRYNNFDALRLIMAGLVLFSHCFCIPFGGEYADPLYRLTNGQMDLGALAVNGFFIMSGYLIAGSWLNSRSIVDYFRKRVLRIYPGYLVVSAFCLLVIAPLAGAALTDVVTVKAMAVSTARALLMFQPRAEGAFSGDIPFAGTLNGSLWTIRYEFACYGMIAVLGLLGIMSRRWLVTGLFVAFFAWHATQGTYLEKMDTRLLGGLLGILEAWPRLITYFLAGSVVYVWRDRIYLNSWLFAVSVLALVVSAFFGLMWVVFPVAFTYFIFYLAFDRRLPAQHCGKYGDFSYGLYLYAWPVQFLLFYKLGPDVNPWLLFGLALPITMALAVLSWKLVESPCLKRKTKPIKPTAPAPAGAATVSSASVAEKVQTAMEPMTANVAVAETV